MNKAQRLNKIANDKVLNLKFDTLLFILDHVERVAAQGDFKEDFKTNLKDSQIDFVLNELSKQGFKTRFIKKTSKIYVSWDNL